MDGRRCGDSKTREGAVEQKMRDLRLDVLPETYIDRDDGCEVAASCLRCPLPRCKYDDPGALRRQARDERDAEIRAARRREGLTAPELARRFKVSERTVFRAVGRGRGKAGKRAA